MKLLKDAAVRLDTWMNAITGLGTMARDKAESTAFVRTTAMGAEFLDGLYSSDDMAARIVDKIPTEGMRKGYRITIRSAKDGEDADEKNDMAQSDALTSYLAALHADPKFLEAWVWGRLYGLAAVYVLADDGAVSPALPLQEQSIKAIRGLVVLEKSELHAYTYYRDVTHPKFGEPETYRIMRTGGGGASAPGDYVVHESRLILFTGTRVSKRERLSLQGAGFSVLERAYVPLRAFQTAWACMGHLMTDASQGVFKLHGLVEIMAQGGRQELQDRMEVVDMGRSVSRALLVDAEREDFRREPHGMQGLDLVMQQFALRLAAAAEMPVSLLMGQSAAGLNATGEGDRKFFYDLVSGHQEMVLRPALERLISLACLDKSGPFKGVPPKWELAFNPLEQLNELEQADLRLKQSQVDTNYINAGVLLAEEVGINRFRVSGWSPDTSIDVRTRSKVLEAEKERAENFEEPPTEKWTGVQTTSAQAIVAAVASGAISRESGVNLLVTGYAITPGEANAILGPASFTPAPPVEPTPAPAVV